MRSDILKATGLIPITASRRALRYGFRVTDVGSLGHDRMIENDVSAQSMRDRRPRYTLCRRWVVMRDAEES
jgi:hypothetical protein